MTALLAYIDLTVGGDPDALAEVRWRLRDGGMGQEFVRARDRRRLAALITARGRTTDTYVGAAPRGRHAGGRDAVTRVHVLWADCDDDAAIAALGRFEPPPSMVVRSGSGRHAYWSLWPPLPPEWAEKANHRLAYALGADMRATDAARILRPPGTFNFKTGEPVAVTVEHVDTNAVYTPAGVVDGMADPSERERPARAVRSVELDPGDPLLAISPEVYVEALSGQGVGRDGKVACPFHDDRTPSLHVYPTSEEGWHCYGCGAGGDIFTFAGLVWGLKRRGGDFIEIRRRLKEVVSGVLAA